MTGQQGAAQVCDDGLCRAAREATEASYQDELRQAADTEHRLRTQVKRQREELSRQQEANGMLKSDKAALTAAERSAYQRAAEMVREEAQGWYEHHSDDVSAALLSLAAQLEAEGAES